MQQFYLSFLQAQPLLTLPSVMAADVEEAKRRQLVLHLGDVGGGVVEILGQPAAGFRVWGLGFGG